MGGHRRTLDLDDDLLAGAQGGSVHRGDRGSGDRCALEVREHVLEAGAEVGLHDGPHHVEGLGRHLVAALLELGDEFGREQTLAARDDLTELDVGGTEGLGGATEAERDLGAARLRGGVALAARTPHPHPDGSAEDEHHTDDATPGREALGAGEHGDLAASRLAQVGSDGEPRDRVAIE